MRIPESNNQVFFIDTSGALCSRSSGHAVDVEGKDYGRSHNSLTIIYWPGDRIVLRHRRPVSHPFPNSYSHRLPNFSYSNATGEISIAFTSDPSYPPPHLQSSAWMRRSYVLASIPMRKPSTLLDNASAFISTAFAAPLSFFAGDSGSPTKATPDEVFNGDIDLKEDDMLEEDRGEEGEVDDSPEGMRRVRVLCITDQDEDKRKLAGKARTRRRWEVIPLRKSNKRTVS